MKSKFFALGIVVYFFVSSCNQKATETPKESVTKTETPDYFNLRPELEKAYGYSHAVRIGNDIKISGAVSLDDKGNLTAEGSMD